VKNCISYNDIITQTDVGLYSSHGVFTNIQYCKFLNQHPLKVHILIFQSLENFNSF